MIDNVKYAYFVPIDSSVTWEQWEHFVANVEAWLIVMSVSYFCVVLHIVFV